MDVLPVEYHYEFYTTSFYNDPFYACKTSNPLATISVGDYLDRRGFSGFPLEVAQGSRLRIAEVEHILWEIENHHIGHKVMFVVDIVQSED